MSKQDSPNGEEIQVSINLDTTPVLYTDNILMSINADGVMLDIGQKLGNGSNLRIVSRIGMSREHATRLVRELSTLLAMSDGSKKTGN